MAGELYYYSTAGTDSQGPVPPTAIRQLAQNGVLHAGSFVCLAGASEWKPFNLADFAAPAPPTPPPAPAPPPAPDGSVAAPPAAKPYVPPTPAMYSPEPWQDLNAPPERMSSDTIKLILDIITVVFVLGFGLVFSFLNPPPADQPISYKIGYYCGSFVVSMLIVAVVPFLVCLLFKEISRCVVRLVGVILVACALAAVQLIAIGHQAATIADIQKTDQELKDEAKQQLATDGVYKGNPEKAKEALDKLDSQATGDTELARGTRALVGVMNELYAKVKAAEAVGATCNFDVSTITDTDDITKRCDNLQKLRASQGDVIDFLQKFDTHARDALTKANVTPTTADEMIAGTHKTGHFPTLITIWQTQQKLCDDHIARFSYLSKNYGSWNIKNGEVVFSDAASKDKYNTFTTALQDDTHQIADAQKQLTQ